MEINKLKGIIAKWARSEPLVTKAYLYGSRTQGERLSSSDVDVAVELKMMPNDSSLFTTWMHEQQGLHDRLQNLLPCKLHLEWYGGKEDTPTIHKGIKNSGILIYKKNEK